ncbi:MAG: cadmium-translocating P-type ATPase [Micavibrio aeruginosavorus]|uniref:Cadmium-translocating P-type ATPase n=1 Tax=Micavibrio aeruginosavorus TaxID=349221 RepID=A0A7T5UG21_9BACT|nr:MAG: cadmium-translocating P-type ATPase [Micavibrio aeruginosavorus]
MIEQNPGTLSRIIPYVHTDHEGIHHLALAVEGVHCAGCIQKIEAALHKQPYIQHARLNFSTRRLNISWKGLPESADHIYDILSSLGYKSVPFNSLSVVRNHEEEAKFLLLCMGVAGFAAGNIMLVSFALWTTDAATMGVAMRDFLHWVSALIALPAIAFSGRPFFRSAWQALKSRRTNMDVPISVGLILTTLMSLFELATHGEHAYFDSAVMLMFFLLIGRYLDYLARSSARSAADDLLGMMSGTITILDKGQPRTILIRDIREDHMMLIAAGEHIPADGIVVSGISDIDTSVATGESIPRITQPGDFIASGCLNLSSPLTVKALRNAEDSQVGNMIRLMEKAEQSQACYVRIADKVARLYTPVVHILALIAFVSWITIGHAPWQDAMMIAATVLIITCPCALALAVPVVQVLTVGLLMKRGIMVRAGDVLEKLDNIDTIIMDKTGTLTKGKPALINAYDIPPEEFMLAASLAAHSRHPLSQALRQAYTGEIIDLIVEEIPGNGLRALFQGQEIRLGRRIWVTTDTLPEHPDAMEIIFSCPDKNPTAFLFKDTLRDDAAGVIDNLKNKGYNLLLLSGDRPDIVKNIAETAGIPAYQGNTSPEDKYKKLEELQQQGHKIMMVGDGINDAPILAGADVSVTPSSGIDIARNAADAVFHGDHLQPILTLINAGTISQSLIRQNFILTIIYNAIAIPLAFSGLVTPLIAAIAMSLSSLAVTINAFRIRKAL